MFKISALCGYYGLHTKPVAAEIVLWREFKIMIFDFLSGSNFETIKDKAIIRSFFERLGFNCIKYYKTKQTEGDFGPFWHPFQRACCFRIFSTNFQA